MKLHDFDSLMRRHLEIDKLEGIDSSANGLQVQTTKTELRRIAFAVDASRESFRRAVEWSADLLFVHHGLFWGTVSRITGNLYIRLRYLIEHDLALYAAHLPLDMHPTLGNNSVLSRRIGLTETIPFAKYKGVCIGYWGSLPEESSISDLAMTLSKGEERSLTLLPFGPEIIRKVGVVSGGGSFALNEALNLGLDLFITGEPSHTMYHECMEEKLNVIFGGHYLTETGGVEELSRMIAETTECETVFIDIPTGL